MKPFHSIAMAVVCGLSVQAQTNTNAAAESTNAAGGIPARVTTNAPAESRPPRAQTLISSESSDFDMTRRKVVYHGRVWVDDPVMKLTCEWLTANLPDAGERMTNIVAETNVIIDFTDNRGQTNHASGDKAVYVFAAQNGATNEMVTLTGNAKLENSQMTLTGEPIYWDRANNTLHADHEKIILRQSLNSATPGTNSPPATNQPAATPR